MAPRRGEERRCLRTTSAGGAGRSLLWDAAAGKARWSRSSGGWASAGHGKELCPAGRRQGSPRRPGPRARQESPGLPRAPARAVSALQAPSYPRHPPRTEWEGTRPKERLQSQRTSGFGTAKFLPFFLYPFEPVQLQTQSCVIR